eukprot:TRINITY_DN1012_c0_g1_i1.p1 TRINITY_DN1012_c0_g1~~TRINITY_DN1012_c0_g1_i1.p1  ORF type:complete len:1125 (+),score=235.22 TRINITY_DN1012_c0_g1_i1:110-3484(+)
MGLRLFAGLALIAPATTGSYLSRRCAPSSQRCGAACAVPDPLLRICASTQCAAATCCQTEVLGVLHHSLRNHVSIVYATDVVPQLPEAMQENVTLFIKMRFLKVVPFCRDADTQTRAALAQALRNEFLPPDTRVGIAGEEGEEMFFLAHGFCDVVSYEGEHIVTRRNGARFGEITLLVNSRRTASIVTVTLCDLFVRSLDDFYMICDASPCFAESIRTEIAVRGSSGDAEATCSPPYATEKGPAGRAPEDLPMIEHLQRWVIVCTVAIAFLAALLWRTRRTASDQPEPADPSWPQICVKTINGATLLFKPDPQGAVVNLKMLIEERTGIPSYQQRLCYQGRILEGTTRIAEHHIQREGTVHLTMALPGGMRGFKALKHYPGYPPHPAPIQYRCGIWVQSENIAINNLLPGADLSVLGDNICKMVNRVRRGRSDILELFEAFKQERYGDGCVTYPVRVDVWKHGFISWAKEIRMCPSALYYHDAEECLCLRVLLRDARRRFEALSYLKLDEWLVVRDSNQKIGAHFKDTFEEQYNLERNNKKSSTAELVPLLFASDVDELRHLGCDLAHMDPRGRPTMSFIQSPCRVPCSFCHRSIPQNQKHVLCWFCRDYDLCMTCAVKRADAQRQSPAWVDREEEAGPGLVFRMTGSYPYEQPGSPVPPANNPEQWDGQCGDDAENDGGSGHDEEEAGSLAGGAAAAAPAGGTAAAEGAAPEAHDYEHDEPDGDGADGSIEEDDGRWDPAGRKRRRDEPAAAAAAGAGAAQQSLLQQREAAGIKQAQAAKMRWTRELKEFEAAESERRLAFAERVLQKDQRLAEELTLEESGKVICAINDIEDPAERQRRKREFHRNAPEWAPRDPTTLRSWAEQPAKLPEPPIEIMVFSSWDADKVLPVSPEHVEQQRPADPGLNGKLAIWLGRIFYLQVDALVTPVDELLRPFNALSRYVHKQAGPWVERDLAKQPLDKRSRGGLVRCTPGGSAVTRGYRLFARGVIHAVTPVTDHGRGLLYRSALRGTYRSCLEKAKKHGFKTVAFPPLGTGVDDLISDTHASLGAIREWLDEPENAEAIDRIILCVTEPHEHRAYELMLEAWFPHEDTPGWRLDRGPAAAGAAAAAREDGAGAAAAAGT